jgi:hypothetical protein
MSAVNEAVIEIVEAVLTKKGQLDDNSAFSELMNLLMENTQKFWDEHKDAIPVQHHIWFGKCK